MSARGAADFMTRLTTILATIFVLLSISLAFVAAREGGSSKIDTSLERTELPATQTAAPEAAPASDAAPAPAQVAPATEVPLDK
jgi:preprotein translocase subunit SecG